MVLKFIENVGDKSITSVASFLESFKFAFICIGHMLNPRSYNPAMRMVLVKQIYFTAVTISSTIYRNGFFIWLSYHWSCYCSSNRLFTSK